MVLLERDALLRSLDDVLLAGRKGVGGVRVVRGEPGAGKTAILREGVRRAAAAGMAVFRARATALEQDFAWGTAHALLARAPIPATGAALLAAPVLGTAPDAPVRPAGTAPDAEARHAVAHGLYWHLADLAERRPAAVFVDDAHWADDASLAFLVHLAERLDGVPVALVVAARGRADPGRHALLAHLEAVPGARRHVPAPLTPAGVGRLVAERLGADAEAVLGAACHRASGGNPFLAGELVAALHRAGPPGGGWDASAVATVRPANVARSVAARLAGLPPEAVALAEAVATLGGRPEIHVAARVAGLGADDASRAADRLAQAGLLTPDRPVDFVHPLVEAAVRDALPAGARALAHQRAFDALVADGADPLVATPHLLRAEPRGRPETAALLARAAGDAMTRGDPAGAVALLRRALRESAGSRRDPELLAALGRAELAAGEPEGIDRLDEALAHCTVPRDRAALALAIAVARYDRGETALARRALAVGLREPLPEDDDARVSLLATDLTIRRSLVDPVHAVQPRAVAETLQRHGDGRSPVERLTLAHLAFRGLQTGALAHHAVVDLATRALPPPGGPPDPLDDLALPLAGMALYFSGAEPRAEEAFGAAGARAQGAGAPVAFATACFFRGSARYLMGQLQAAADDYDVALEAASERGWAHSLPSARALRALIAMEQDEPALADELLATLPGGDDRWSTHPTFPYALCVRGVRAVATGDPAGGLALLLRAGERQRELGLANPAVLHWQAEAAVAALAAGRPDDARPLADDLLARARRYGALRPLGIAERVAGLVHPGPSGLELLARSTVTLGASNARLELARSLLDLGCALRRSGARTDARETLRAAADEGERCGAVVLVTRATEELHLAGARPRRSRTSGPAALTSGERRVAALAAEGLTNREIAQRLFVTRRTVETHLTHVYGKLGTDRTGLRAALDADD